MNQTSFSPIQRALAWGVHLFTASGLVAGFMALLAVKDHDWREATLWLMLALVIDGIDGTFARLVRVKEVLPHMDGKTIDYVIDFATYAIIPAFFFYEAELTSPELALPCAAMMLLVSAIYYGKEGMVSDDLYFIGFPVLWNLVVVYQVFVFELGPIGNTIVVLVFSILHFVPIKFAYPSQATRFRWLSLTMSALAVVSLVALVWQYPDRNVWMTNLAIIGGAYFGFMAIYNTWLE